MATLEAISRDSGTGDYYANGVILASGLPLPSGSSIGFADGSAASPSFHFSSDTNTGIYRSGDNAIAFSTAGIGRFNMGTTALTPVENETYRLGTSSLRWNEVWSNNMVCAGFRVGLGSQRITMDPNELNQFADSMYYTCYNDTTPRHRFRTGPSDGSSYTYNFQISGTAVESYEPTYIEVYNTGNAPTQLTVRNTATSGAAGIVLDQNEESNPWQIFSRSGDCIIGRSSLGDYFSMDSSGEATFTELARFEDKMIVKGATTETVARFVGGTNSESEDVYIGFQDRGTIGYEATGALSSGNAIVLETAKNIEIITGDTIYLSGSTIADSNIDAPTITCDSYTSPLTTNAVRNHVLLTGGGEGMHFDTARNASGWSYFTHCIGFNMGLKDGGNNELEAHSDGTNIRSSAVVQNNDTMYLCTYGVSSFGAGSDTVTLTNAKRLTIDAGGCAFHTDLDVEGSLTVNTAFTFPTSDGSANQVLTTNGSGTVAWGPAATAWNPTGITGGTAVTYSSCVYTNIGGAVNFVLIRADFTGSGGGVTFTAAIPSAIRPLSDIYIPISYTSAAVVRTTLIKIGSSGTITFMQSDTDSGTPSATMTSSVAYTFGQSTLVWSV